MSANAQNEQNPVSRVATRLYSGTELTAGIRTLVAKYVDVRGRSNSPALAGGARIQDRAGLHAAEQKEEEDQQQQGGVGGGGRGGGRATTSPGVY